MSVLLVEDDGGDNQIEIRDREIAALKESIAAARSEVEAVRAKAVELAFSSATPESPEVVEALRCFEGYVPPVYSPVSHGIVLARALRALIVQQNSFILEVNADHDELLADNAALRAQLEEARKALEFTEAILREIPFVDPAVKKYGLNTLLQMEIRPALSRLAPHSEKKPCPHGCASTNCPHADLAAKRDAVIEAARKEREHKRAVMDCSECERLSIDSGQEQWCEAHLKLWDTFTKIEDALAALDAAAQSQDAKEKS